MLSTLRDIAIAVGAVSAAAVAVAAALRLAPVRRVAGWLLAPARWAFGHAAADLGAYLGRAVNRWLIHSELGVKVETIRHQVLPNDGGSLRDAVTRQEVRLDRGEQRFDDLDDRLTEVIERLPPP